MPTDTVPPMTAAAPVAANHSGDAARWFVPSVSDVIFGALLIWLMVFTIGSDGSLGLLQDSNTGYHIRTGDFILEHHTVPHTDIFSFSRPGQPWFAWEWLCAILFSVLYSAGGMKLLVIFCGAIIALSSLILLRHLIWRGANALVAIVVLHFVMAASSIHDLARPHVFTFLFLVIGLWLIDADRRKPSAYIWMLVPITVVWVNLHGGFLALLVSLGIVAAGSALEGRWNAARRYTLVGAACLAGSGINPYGFAVHAHAFWFLKERWIVDLVQEYQSPRFGSSESHYFEILLFAGVALSVWLLSQKQIASALLILAWTHAALTSLRHIPIFCIAVAPLLALEMTRLWDRWARSARRGSIRAILGAVANEHTHGLRRSSVWALAPVIALVLFNFGWNWPTDFPEARYPVGVVSKNAEVISRSRIFTMDSWADYLTFRLYPRQRIFVDGRCDFFGREMSEQYVQILRGQYGWDVLMKQYNFDAALIPPQSALASLLRLNPEWKVVDQDGLAVLFKK